MKARRCAARPMPHSTLNANAEEGLRISLRGACPYRNVLSRFPCRNPVGNYRQQAFSIALGRVTAVAIAAAQLFELVVQVSHGASILW